MPQDPQPWLWLASLLWLGALYFAFTGWKRSRGLTVRAALAWASAALAAQVVSEWGHAAMIPPALAAAIRAVAVSTSLCPMAAVLGAKRPQAHAWQFVVTSLWLVLTLPFLVSYGLFVPGRREMGAIPFGFALVLILMGIGNYLATRHGIAAILIGAAQLTLLWLADHAKSNSLWYLAPAALTLVGAAWVACRPAGRRSTKTPDDRLWLAFRDCYGAVWGVRVAERVNAMGRKRGWPQRLTWFGIVDSPNATPPLADGSPAGEFQRAFHMVLRSFVTADWIAEHAQTPPLVGHPRGG